MKPSELTDLEELVDSAIADEDSGDRWRTSDLSKSLRFYQSAFTCYCRAIEVCQEQQNPAIHISECYYNALRLLFLVYNQFQGCECIDLGLLTSYPEVLQEGSNCVIQELDQILAAHENAIRMSGSAASTDLLYNTALVYTEVIENLESEQDIIEALQRSITLFQQIFKTNVDELHINVQGASEQGASEPNRAISNVASTDDAGAELFESKRSQPRDIVDTAISMFTLFRTYIDSSAIELDQAIVTGLQSTLSEVDTVVNKLLNDYHKNINDSLSILEEQKNEYMIAREYAISTLLDLNSSCLNWDNDSLPETAERYMLAADSIQSILDRISLRLESENGFNNGPNQSDRVEVYWSALSKINNYLKKALEILMKRKAELVKATGSEQRGLGALILQICTVCVARADVDQQRRRLHHPEGQAHLELLGRNVLAFLKNAVAMSMQSGGIRETTVEKLQREKCRINAQVRLYLLDGLSAEAISSQFKGNLWQEEYDLCSSSWYYK